MIYSKEAVNRAGKALIENPPESIEYRHAMDALTYWRSLYVYPMNTFQATLRTKVRGQSTAVVAQRLKRTPSIIRKLRQKDSMRLTQMQDIGGLRAILKTLEQIRGLTDQYKNSRLTHELVNEKDYITTPKSSGYRGIHLIYRYKHPRDTKQFDGLLLELQFRTQLQHAWATAVETSEIFIKEGLKWSEGPQEWLDFFSLTSSAFAYTEDTPRVPGYEHMSLENTWRKVADEENRLHVIRKLEGFKAAVSIGSKLDQGNLHLVQLNTEKQTVVIKSFGLKRQEEANEEYSKAEAKMNNGEPINVVLVSSTSLEAVRKAYPNYFLDATIFIRHLRGIIRVVRTFDYR